MADLVPDGSKLDWSYDQGLLSRGEESDLILGRCLKSKSRTEKANYVRLRASKNGKKYINSLSPQNAANPDWILDELKDYHNAKATHYQWPWISKH